ncbi:GntR family transcriptional regulator [Pseudoclavibacter sp. AY1F1]|uniref:aminotransferase-like domain-containing protein n=1 Tax=Pseudoclavibacter sp. AY1F1 TaxID=2080583 RepID=UPI000CE73622|nr:PLP-dependent aminotransferase family protein [Pseudoclavibacter sp. AY1F1]PPF44850.1 GntR family transcriptional regulator [Pseudoclavibacter sp. AY1F1]
MSLEADDEIYGSIDFLNTIAHRYPASLSLAAGAPTLDHVSGETFMDALNERKRDRSMFSYHASRGLINDVLARHLSAVLSATVDPGDVVVTVGAQEAMLLIMRALDIRERGSLGIVAPAFPGVRGAAAFLDLPTVDIDERSDGFNPEDLEAAILRAKTEEKPIRAVYLATDNSNPSGSVLDLQSRIKLLKLAQMYELILIEDTTYAFTSDVPLPSLAELDTNGCVVQIGTFSKLVSPSLRVGYLLTEVVHDGASLAKRVALLKNMTTVNTPALSQIIVARMLEKDYPLLSRASRGLGRAYRKRLSALLAYLDEMLGDLRAFGVTWSSPSAGFFVVVETPWRMGEEQLELSAAEFKVLWTPMRFFYKGAAGDTSLRLSCSAIREDDMRIAVHRLGCFLTHLQRTETL